MLTADLVEKFKQIKYLILDVDGVLTDGTFYVIPGMEQNIDLKAFNSQDGFGLKMLQKAGIEIIIISGRASVSTEMRMQQLAINKVFLGVKNKLELFHKLCQDHNINPQLCAYVGDDIPDLEVMREVGLRITVANANKIMHQFADYQTNLSGGHGAVREVCDLLLSYQGKHLYA